MNGAEVKCAGDFRLAAHHLRKPVRMAERHRPGIELVLLALAEHFFRRHLQDHRLHRHAHRRQRDAVLVGEILDGLDVGIDAVEVERHRVERADALDLEIALGARPDRDHRADAAGGEIEIAGDQRLVHRRAAGEAHPFGGKIEPEFLAFGFEQLLLRHDRQRQVGNAVLRGDAHDARLGIGGVGGEQRRSTAAASSAQRHLCRCLWLMMSSQVAFRCSVFAPDPSSPTIR